MDKLNLEIPDVVIIQQNLQSPYIIPSVNYLSKRKAYWRILVEVERVSSVVAF